MGMEDTGASSGEKGESEENKSMNSKEIVPKKPIGRLFGVEISAPEGMKNPLLRLAGLILINILLLVLLKMALKT